MGGSTGRTLSRRGPDPRLLDELRDLTQEELDEFARWKGWSPEQVADLVWWIAHGWRYFERPVDVKTFLFNRAYMRALDEHGDTFLWPALVKAITDVCTGSYVEALFTGAIGCWPGDAEVLTPHGWVRMDSWGGELVAEYDPGTGCVDFRDPEEFVDAPADGWWTFERDRFVKKVSPEHKVLLVGRSGARRVATADDLGTGRVCRGSYTIPDTFSVDRQGVEFSDEQLRVMVAVLCDGNFRPRLAPGNPQCRVGLRKQRKKDRLEELLSDAGLGWYTNGPYGNRPTEVTYFFDAPLKTKSWDFLWGCNAGQLKVVLDEIPHWDGLHPDSSPTGEWRFHTTLPGARDFVQYACHATGRRTSVRWGARCWVVQAWDARGNGVRLEGTDAKWESPKPGERKYCFVTRSGFFVVRYRNRVMVSGNTGKSTGGLYVHAYKLYELLCQKNPHGVYGLDPASEIMIVFQAPTKEAAREVDYERFRAMLDRAPIFSDVNFKYNRDVKSRMEFPKRIVVQPIAGLDTSALGRTVIGGQLEELAAMAYVQKSARTRDREAYDQAVELYTAISRRRESRFLDQGEMPGMLTLVSSKKYPDDLIHRKLLEARDKPDRIFVYDKRLWDVRPAKYSKRRFRVFTGDDTRKPRILREAEQVDPADEALILRPPVDFIHAFEEDLLKALRDVGGVSTLSVHPFILDRDALAEAFGKCRSVGTRPDCDFEQARLGIRKVTLARVLAESRDCPRYVHIDLSKSQDSCGLAICHVRGFKRMRRSETTSELWPIVRFDLLLEVRPPRGGEIRFEKVRRLLYMLKERGMPLRWASCDSFQSVDMMQILHSKGFIVGEESADRTTGPYEVLKSAIYDRRVEFPAHPRALEELTRLERDPKTGKVDHPSVDGCFTGETRVALADGTCPTMGELSRRGEAFWVYSVGEDGEVQVTKAGNACVTRHTGELVEVMLDNYQLVRCTPDHLWMLLGGSWAPAGQLGTGASVMPLYRKMEWRDGYEKVWCPGRGRWVLGHHLNLEPGVGQVVHHLDGDKRNNAPPNLRLMAKTDHARLHSVARWAGVEKAMHAGHARYVEDRGRRVSRETIRRAWAAGKFGPPTAPCSVSGCGDLSNARGLCGAHYQRARRRGELPARRGRRRNHRVLAVRLVHLLEPVPVYDLTVPGPGNFALAAGAFVHNSKDVADAAACAAFGITLQTEVWTQYNVPLYEVPMLLTDLAEAADRKGGVEGKVA